MAIAALVALGATYQRLSTPQPVIGAEAVAVQPGGELVLLAGGRLLIHDRAGHGESELSLASMGVDNLAPPLVFTAGAGGAVNPRPDLVVI